MPLLAQCPQDQGQAYGPLTPIAVVLHRTYGQWPGDYAVIKRAGLAHFLVGKNDGQWVQFADTYRVQYHCNGANFKAVGIELTGVNEEPLTDWQTARLGDIMRFLQAAHGINLAYTDPYSVPWASIWVNGGDFRGVCSHVSVRTDDGSSQHTDMISPNDYARAVGATPGPVPPTPAPVDHSEDDTMLIINRTTKEMAILCGFHRPRKIASINDYQRGTFVTLDADAWQQYWDDAIKLYDSVA